MPIIEARHISYAYDNKRNIIDDVSFNVDKGEFIGILGANGSGKTTLVRLLNRLLKINKGSLIVNGLDLSDDKNIKEIKKYVGMVFQNPDNQFVSSIVYDDLTFYPRNLGVDEKTIEERIDNVLNYVNMYPYKYRATNLLSGGQKQKIAIASVLVAKNEIIIFDEVTSMLDKQGKDDVLNIIDKLHKDGKTIIYISHVLDEVIKADRVLLMHEGKIIKDDVARNILNDKDLLEKANLKASTSVSLYYDLKNNGINLSKCPINNEELVEELCKLK